MNKEEVIMDKIKERELKHEKADAKRIAKQLFYDTLMPDVFKRIDNCKNVVQVTNVLAACRHMM